MHSTYRIRIVLVVAAFSFSVHLLGCAPAAKLVIGQPDFTSNLPNQGKGSAEKNTLHVPAGPVIIYQDALYIADAWNDRILRFSPLPKQNDPSASGVIRSADPGKWRNFERPYGLSIDDGKMLVVDMENSRVLIWNTIPTGSETPDVVLGQVDLTSPAIADCSHFSEPRAVLSAGGKVIVSDWFNHRILIWNSIPTRTNTKNPIAADLILGDPDCRPDVTASKRHTFNEPRGIWSDGTRLVVADTGNHRVLIWTHFPTNATDDADIVLGTGKAGAGKQQLNGPYSVDSDGTRLFVADWHNNRVLMWDAFPVKDGDAPSRVFGQRNFSRWGRNGAAREVESPPPPSASALNAPQGVYYRNNQLWVTDTDNNRIVMFEVK